MPSSTPRLSHVSPPVIQSRRAPSSLQAPSASGTPLDDHALRDEGHQRSIAGADRPGRRVRGFINIAKSLLRCWPLKISVGGQDNARSQQATRQSGEVPTAIDPALPSPATIAPVGTPLPLYTPPPPYTPGTPRFRLTNGLGSTGDYFRGEIGQTVQV